MKMRTWKSILAILLAVATMATMAGCKGSSKSDTAQSSASSDAADTGIDTSATKVYKMEQVTAGSANNANYNGLYSDGNGNVYATEDVYEENEAGEYFDTIKVIKYDADFNPTTLLELSLDSETYASNTLFQKDGSFSVVLSHSYNPDMEYDETDENFDYDAYYDGMVYEYTLQNYDAEGNKVSETALNGYPTVLLQSEEGIYAVYTDDDGNYKLDIIKDGKATSQDFTTDCYSFDSGNVLADGTMLIMGQDENGISTIYQLAEDGTMTDYGVVFPKSGNYWFTSIVPAVSEEEGYLLYMISDDGIYGVKNDKTIARCLSFSDCGISNGGGIICNLGGGEFITTDYDYSDDNTIAYLEKLTPNENADSMQTLTLAVYYADSDTEEAVAKFNRSSDTCHIVIKDYSDYDDYSGEGDEEESSGIVSTGQLRFQEDLAAGEIPDMVMPYNLNEDNLAKQGLLVDLYSLLDDSSDFQKDDILENYREANEIDGKLYWLTSGFSIRGMAMNKAYYAGTEEGMTYQQMADSVKKANDANLDLAQYDTPQDICLYLLENSLVNSNTGLCDLAEPGASDMLINVLNGKELVYPEVDDESEDTSESDAFWAERDALLSNGKLLLNYISYSDFYSYMCDKYSWGDTDIVRVGPPSADGTGGLGMDSYYDISITTACKDTTDAMAFIQQMVDVDATSGGIYMYPILQDDFDAYIDYDIEEYNSIDQTYYDSNTGEELSMEAPTEEDIADYKALITSTNRRYYVNTDIQEMFTEETDSWENGDITAEQMVSDLQNKVSLYMSENS